MAVLTPVPAAPADAPAAASSAQGPACSLQRVAPQGAPGKSGSLWQLGIEAQELTAAIGRLAEQLGSDEPDQEAEAIAQLEAVLLAEEGNKQALAAKADATCWVIEHLRAQAAYRQQQARPLTDLARADSGRAERLEESLLLVLTRLQPQATRFSFAHHELRSTRSTAVEIENELLLDPEWLTVKTTFQPDKKAIKEALKQGQEIAGAVLVERRSWRIT